MTVQGVAASPTVKCEGIVSGKLVEYSKATVATTKETLGFVFARAPQRTTSGESVFEEATVVVTTNVGNYSVFLPRDTRLPESQATQIAKTLDGLTQQLSATQAALNTKIDATAKLIPKAVKVNTDYVGTPWESHPAGNNANMITCRDGMVMTRFHLGSGLKHDYRADCVSLTLVP